MKPRPIHRWKSFWLGLSVVLFLAWAWLDSYHGLSECFLKLGNREAQFSRAKGVTYVYLRQGDTYLTSLPPGEFQLETSRLPAYWPNIWEWLEKYGAPQARIPDAPIFYSYLGLWSGLLAWHRRRMRRRG